ncbi:hypothetical protein IB267_32960, partial [Ensifer sp. ENS09]|uniref:phosphopantetheine-binding protein n=1 Tax=Ensifer sp. ENS09 TaxID=2769263 RepID=UPI00177D8215
IEQILAAIWSDLLGVDRVSRNDHFFELGGHSLLAVQLMERLRRTLSVQVPIRSVFENPVLQAMAKVSHELFIAREIY